MTGGRLHRRTLVAILGRGSAGEPLLASPGVGSFRCSSVGTLVRPGATVGELEVLGELLPVVAPPGAHGLSVDPGDGAMARRPVAYGDPLVILDVDVAARDEEASADGETESAGTVFPSPTSGRYYGRPAPDAPPFVSAGDVVSRGQTVALLEVMKTFNRVQYGGVGFPEQARVVRIVPENEADLSAGDPILELEPLG